MAKNVTKQDLERLNESVRKLHQLLDDPQPGLHTWMIMLGERMEKVRNQINELIRSE